MHFRLPVKMSLFREKSHRDIGLFKRLLKLIDHFRHPSRSARHLFYQKNSSAIVLSLSSPKIIHTLLQDHLEIRCLKEKNKLTKTGFTFKGGSAFYDSEEKLSTISYNRVINKKTFKYIKHLTLRSLQSFCSFSDFFHDTVVLVPTCISVARGEKKTLPSLIFCHLLFWLFL